MKGDEVVSSQVFQLDEVVAFHPERPVKKLLLSTDRLRSAVICLRAGQALGEHAAPGEAVIHVLSGRALVGVGGEAHEARQGTVLHLPAGALHSVAARADTVLQVVVALPCA